MTLRTITYDDAEWQVVPKVLPDELLCQLLPVAGGNSHQVERIAAAVANWRALQSQWRNVLDALPEPPAQQINQCDGCRRGLPVNERGIHRGEGYDLIACTAHLYRAPAQQPMGAEQIASACYTYRHDFGLLPEVERHLLMAEARRWAAAFGIDIGKEGADGAC